MNKWVDLAGLFICLTLCSGFLFSGPAVTALLSSDRAGNLKRGAETASWIVHTTQTSDLLLGALSGPLIDFCGARVAFVGSSVVLAYGYKLFYSGNEVDLYYSAIIQGAVVQCMVNSAIVGMYGKFHDAHIPISVFNSASDLAAGVLPLALGVIHSMPESVTVATFFKFMMCMAVVTAIVGHFSLQTPSEDKLEKHNSWEKILLPGTTIDEYEDTYVDFSDDSAMRSWTNILWTQMCSIDNVLNTLIFAMMLMRVNLMTSASSSLFRSHLEEADAVYADAVLSTLLPVSFVLCIVSGVYMNRKGEYKCYSVLNYLLIFSSLCFMSPYLSLHLVGCIAMTAAKSSVFSCALSVVSRKFNPSHFGLMAAMASLFGGLVNIALGDLLLKATIKVDRGWDLVHVTFLIVGVISVVLLNKVKYTWKPGNFELFDAQSEISRIAFVASVDSRFMTGLI